ncbi:MAG: 5'-nucleotidase C-terminal domain-containing protein [bacterium]|nr:5'-nucleotidase C-terminal domain-containing protein [bacterium]
MKMKMNHKYYIYSITILICLILVCSPAPAAAKKVKLTILYTNDVHGHILPFDDAYQGKDAGGIARRVTVIKQIKKQNPNTLLLDAGDLLSGTPISGFFKGEADWKSIELAGYDAMAIGNHDFDYGQEVLRNAIKTCKVPLLSANIIEQSTGNLLAKPYLFKSYSGLTVAIIGLTTPTAPTSTHPKNVVGLSFGNPQETVQKYLPELRKKAKLIIVLSHLGYGEDRELAEQVNGIDIIVGGHSHTKLLNYQEVNRTIIVQALQWGLYLGRLDVTVEKGKIIDKKAELIPITNTIPEDTKVAQALSVYADKVKQKMAEVVGETKVDLVRGTYENPQSNLSTWIADVFRETAQADIAFQNSGGIRANINKGKITYNDIYSVLPFENVLVTIELTGAQVQELFDFIASAAQSGRDSGQISGATFTVRDGKAVNILIGGKPLSLDKTYKLATNDFLASGGSRFTVLKQGKIIHYGDNLRDVLINYLKTHPVINPVSEVRIKF